MSDFRVRLQTAPCGLLRVVSPNAEIVYLAIREGDQMHPIWEEKDLSLFIGAKAGSDGELVIDLRMIVRPSNDGQSGQAIAA